MGSNRFRFIEEEEPPPPPSVWVTRAVVTGLILGIAGAAHILLGFRFF
jgi:hypothetical protein